MDKLINTRFASFDIKFTRRMSYRSVGWAIRALPDKLDITWHSSSILFLCMH